MSIEKQEALFLHERNPKLHATQEIESVAGYLRAGGDKIPNDPAVKIASYVGFLAATDYVNDGLLTGDANSIERQVMNNVIRPEEFPESYFELQQRIDREQGRGNAPITEATRSQMIQIIRLDQKGSLREWANYLSDDEANYPAWFRLYAFDSVKKLGIFDKESGEFAKRTKGTTTRFPDLNREALAYVYDRLYRAKILGQPAEEDAAEVHGMIKNANFAKLYAHAIQEISPATKEQLEIIDGEWVTYEQIEGDYTPHYQRDENGEYYDDYAEAVENETALKLARSIQGHGTGWCTAGETTAATQLSSGDFYVYYSYDKDGVASIPRIAIRTNNGKVAEVRGIVGGRQELEPIMYDILVDQLDKLDGGDSYFEKVQNMQRLTALDAKNHSGAMLTKEELLFLYEVEGDIRGFGYDEDDQGDAPDPRVKEILDNRDFIDDLATMFGVSDDQTGAERLFEIGQKRLLANNLHRFNTIDSAFLSRFLDDPVAREYIEGEDAMGYELAYYLIECLPRVTGELDSIIASTLLDGAGFDVNPDGISKYDIVTDTILAEIERFDDAAKSLINDCLLGNMETWLIAERLSDFSHLDMHMAMRLLDAGEEVAVFNNLKSFKDYVANDLIERSYDDEFEDSDEDFVRFNDGLDDEYV